MICGVYKIVCGGGKYYYFGSSANIDKRYKDHLARLKRGTHYNKFMQSVYNKYGPESFSCIVIEEVKLGETLTRENHYILESYGKEGCMNLTKDAKAPMRGQVPWNKGKLGTLIHTPESREAISKNNAKYWKGKKREALAEKFLGHKVTQETREKISDKLTGVPLSQNTKDKMKGRVPWNKGKKGLQRAWNKGLKKSPLEEETSP